MMKRQREFMMLLGFTLLALMVAWNARAESISPDAFRAETTGDMIKLCGAKPDSDNYVAAIHFCQGFATGAFQYYQSVSASDSSMQFVCLPNPEPTRSEAIAGFLAWARANPKVQAERPVDSMFHYLGERYPCRR